VSLVNHNQCLTGWHKRAMSSSRAPIQSNELSHRSASAWVHRDSTTSDALQSGIAKAVAGHRVSSQVGTDYGSKLKGSSAEAAAESTAGVWLSLAFWPKQAHLVITQIKSTRPPIT
jgi:hypothetical protein